MPHDPAAVGTPLGSYDPRRLAEDKELTALSFREEAGTLFELAAAGHGSVIEVGTYCGYTALHLAFGIRTRPPARQRGVQLFTVDTHRQLSPFHFHLQDMVELHGRDQPCSFPRFVDACKRHGVWDVVHPIIDDASQAWRRWPHGPAGLLFIDGDHGRAMQDFLDWSRFLVPGGIVCFHDYASGFPAVVRDVDALIASGSIQPLRHVGSLCVARFIARPPSGTPEVGRTPAGRASARLASAVRGALAWLSHAIGPASPGADRRPRRDSSECTGPH